MYKWVKLKERRPEDQEEVLVLIKEEVHRAVFLAKGFHGLLSIPGIFVDKERRGMYFYVSHWIPFPELSE